MTGPGYPIGILTRIPTSFEVGHNVHKMNMPVISKRLAHTHIGTLMFYPPIIELIGSSPDSPTIVSLPRMLPCFYPKDWIF